MDLNCETVLDVYTYKNRKILCQIKVNSNGGKFKNCRCLSQEQWMVFDRNLENLIPTIDDWNNEKCLKFNINPCILVKIQKSTLSLTHFNKCLGTASDFDNELEESNFVLECLFDFKREFVFSPSIDSQESKMLPETSLDYMLGSPLSYDPYTPSKKNYAMNNMVIVKTPGSDFLGYDESTFFPTLIAETESNDAVSTDIIQKPKPMNAIDTEDETESWLNRTVNSKFSKKTKENDVNRKDVIVSREKDRTLQIDSSNFSKTKESLEGCATEETKQELKSQVDKASNSKDQLKSECSLLELKHENTKEKHRSKRKQLKRDNIVRKRSKTPDKLSLKGEKMHQKHKIENINKESHKKPEISSDAEKEKKKVCSPKEKNISGNEDNYLLAEVVATSKHTKEIKKSPKTPIIENPNSTESAIEMSPEKVTSRIRKLKSCRKDAVVSLRRSERSPSKTKRFVEEQTELLKSKKKHKSAKNVDVFGTDDDDELFETKKGDFSANKTKSPFFGTPVTKKPVEHTSSSSSKKRKRDKSAECHQEKRYISKWLSKKNSTPSNYEVKTTSKSTSKSSQSKPLPLQTSTNLKPLKTESDSKRRAKSLTPPPMVIDLPSKEELECMRNKTSLMREENARLKAELDKMRTSPPKEVEILSLENIPEDEILGTFSTHKCELDEIFEKNQKRDYIKGHDGINHCLIIRLLQNSVQMKMLDQLTNVYGCSRQATLFANALLPEWVIRVYMEKFNFSRQQAIEQIKAQEAFKLHMEEQNENSFEFD